MDTFLHVTFQYDVLKTRDITALTYSEYNIILHFFHLYTHFVHLWLAHLHHFSSKSFYFYPFWLPMWNPTCLGSVSIVCPYFFNYYNWYSNYRICTSPTYGPAPCVHSEFHYIFFFRNYFSFQLICLSFLVCFFLVSN